MYNLIYAFRSKSRTPKQPKQKVSSAGQHMMCALVVEYLNIVGNLILRTLFFVYVHCKRVWFFSQSEVTNTHISVITQQAEKEIYTGASFNRYTVPRMLISDSAEGLHKQTWCIKHTCFLIVYQYNQCSCIIVCVLAKLI